MITILLRNHKRLSFREAHAIYGVDCVNDNESTRLDVYRNFPGNGVESVSSK